MTLPQNVEDRIQKLSDRKLSVWQDMATAWLPGSTAPINADAFLSLIAEVRRCRAHLMSQEAEIARLNAEWHEMFDRALLAESHLAAANALLRECVAGLGHVGYPESMAMFNGDHRRAENLHDEILEHLQGAGDEA